MSPSWTKLIPSDPEKVMVIRKVTPDILTLSVPFLRFGRIQLGGRGTVVRLQNGTLAVFSPVAMTDTVRASLRELGRVKYLVALDAEHHIFLEPWRKEYPDSKLIGMDALATKREKSGNPLSWSVLFKKGTPTTVDQDFDREFEYEYVESHQNKELVFNHKPSGTLIEADMLFNLPANEQMSRSGVSPHAGVLTRLMNGINNTKGSAVWQKRFLWYAVSSGDRPSFNRSVSIIDSWNFNRIIPCHGDVIEDDGKAVFRKVFGWHLDAHSHSS